jgi:site-specific recombinase XerD
MYARAGNLKKPTYATILAILKSFYSFLHTEQIMDKNPTEKLLFPKQSRRDHLPHCLDVSEQNTLREMLVQTKRNFTNDRNRAIIAMFIYTGIRTSELCTLTRMHYSQTTSSITITRKGGKQQVIPLPKTLVALLEQYWLPWMSKISSEWFFSQKGGKPMNPRIIWHLVSKELKALQCNEQRKCGAHVLRHTFATNLVRKRAQLIEIQHLLGHSDVKMTQIYTHVSPESLRDTIQLLDE